MATAATLALHPATEKLASYRTWTDNPSVAELVNLAREAATLGARLAALTANDSAVGIMWSSPFGQLVERYEETGHINVHAWNVRPNGGAVADLWERLVDCRDRWIAAKLEVEGYPTYRWTPEQDERAAELAGQAVSVSSLFGGAL